MLVDFVHMQTTAESCTRSRCGADLDLSNNTSWCSLEVLNATACTPLLLSCFSGPGPQLHTMIAKFCFAANLPFCAVDSPYFRALMQVLRPGTKPITGRTLGTTFLNHEYEVQRAVLRQAVCGQPVVLQVDAWSSAKNVPVVALSVGRHLASWHPTPGKVTEYPPPQPPKLFPLTAPHCGIYGRPGQGLCEEPGARTGLQSGGNHERRGRKYGADAQ